MVITAQDTKLRPGYKQTEVGVIPEDWKIEKLGDCLLGAPQYGINAPAVQYTDSLPIYIRITDITDDGCFSPESIASVKYVSGDRYVLKASDLVFARTGASVGKTYLYKPEDGNLVFAGYLIRVKVNPSKLLPSYLAAYVKTEPYWNWVRAMSMRSGQPGINGTEYAHLPIPLPPLSEQRAIATALSDVDALITSLDKLIAKKRDIKQATMQQLLTGKTRLPGFSGEWEVKKLDERCEFYSGGTPSTSNSSFYGGSISWITSSDLNKGRIKEVEGRITKLGFERSSAKIVKKGCLLLALYGATAGVAAITEFDAAINQAVLAIIPQKDNSEFLFQKLTLLKDWLIKTYTQGGQPNLSGQIVKLIEFSLPSKPEQQAIAAVLSDMDAEIAVLEQRRDKARALKQGMMQELLTGKTRLL